LVANGVSAAASGVVAVTGMPALMILVWSLAGVVGAAFQRVDVPGYPANAVLRNLGLAIALMLVAVVFAGLALAFTALCRSEMPDAKNLTAVTPKNVPIQPLSLYVTLTLLGLAFDALALGLLAHRMLEGFRIAAGLGTVLEILALAVGVRRHLRAA
jgi:hypothetical protein